MTLFENTKITSGVDGYKSSWNVTNATDFSGISKPIASGDNIVVAGTTATIDGATYSNGDILIFKNDIKTTDTITADDFDLVHGFINANSTDTLTNKTISIHDNTLTGVVEIKTIN